MDVILFVTGVAWMQWSMEFVVGVVVDIGVR